MQMRIQVLGSGCPTCHKLNELTKQAVKELELKEEVEYATGDVAMRKIIEMGVLQTPVLSIDNQPVMTGPEFDVEKIKNIIKDKLND